MTVRRERGRWVVDFTFRFPDGKTKRFREQSPVDTRRGAEEYERKLREALLDGRRSLNAEAVPTLEEFAPRWIEGHALANRQKYSTVVSKQSILSNHLVPQLGRRRLDEISEEDVQRLKGRLRDKSPKTVNNVLSVLAKLLKTAVRWKVIDRVPVEIELVKAPPPAIEFFDEPTFERLVEGAAKCAPQILAFVLLAGEAGLRAGEVMALCWSDVDLQRRLITVRRTIWRGVEGAPKGGRARVVKMTSRLTEALRRVRHLKGKRVLYRDSGKELTQKTLQTWMEKATRRAGLEPTGKLHILRHTFCSRLAMKGVPARTIQEMAGHVHLSTTQRYMHLSPNAMDDAVRLLEGRATSWNEDGTRAPPGS